MLDGLPARPGVQRLADVGPDGTVGLRPDRDPELDQPQGLLVQRAGGVDRPGHGVVLVHDLTEATAEGPVDLGQVLRVLVHGAIVAQ